MDAFDLDAVRRTVDFMYKGYYEIEDAVPSQAMQLASASSPISTLGLQSSTHPSYPDEVFGSSSSMPLTEKNIHSLVKNRGDNVLTQHVKVNAIGHYLEIEKLVAMANTKIKSLLLDRYQSGGYHIEHVLEAAAVVNQSSEDAELLGLLAEVTSRNMASLMDEDIIFQVRGEVGVFWAEVIRACEKRLSACEHCTGCPRQGATPRARTVADREERQILPQPKRRAVERAVERALRRMH